MQIIHIKSNIAGIVIFISIAWSTLGNTFFGDSQTLKMILYTLVYGG
ncbi:MAG: hypothetical protein IJS90_04715 [Clostridia bacterium]|nr:hypothetical protein [Clostridia bacterium]